MGYPNQPGQPWQQPQQGYAPPQQGYAPQAPAGYGAAPGAPAAGGGYNFGDLWTGADTTAGNLLPEGNYDAVVESCEFGQTRGGDKGAWTIKFRVTTGPQAGALLTMTMAINPTKTDGSPNPAGMGIMFRQLHAMGVPVPPPIGAPGERPFWELGWTEQNVAQQMTGKPVIIRVIQNDWDGGTNNKVKDIKPAKPGAPTTVQQAPQQAPAMGGYQPGQGQPQYGPSGFAPPVTPGGPVSYSPVAAQQGGTQQWANPAGQPAQGPPQAPPGMPPVPGAPQYAQPPQPGQPGMGQFTPQGMGGAPQMPPPSPQGAPPAMPPWAQQAPQNGAPAPQQPGQPPEQPQSGQAPPAPPWGQQ
jgi:hypothetical protein